MTSSLPLLIATAFVASMGCSGPDSPPAPTRSSTLPQGVVARVSDFDIDALTVASIVEAVHVTPRVAVERAVSDALFASGAKARGDATSLAVEAAVRARLARAALEQLYDEVSTEDPSDAEVAKLTARHFAELDRPETFRVIHALVKLPDKADAATTARARAVAERLAEQVAPAKDEQDFRTRSEALTDRDGFELVVETLSPVAADGRVADPEHPTPEIQTYVAPFARAASHLEQRGQKSGIVATEFGFHVLMLLERIPPKTVPLDERRRMLRDEIVTERASQRKTELLKHLAATTPFSIERNADALLAIVGKDPESSQDHAPSH
jgi:peptidyl-prolyl cis-trans isomerase C